MLGTCRHLPSAASSVSRWLVTFAVLFVTNQGGRGRIVVSPPASDAGNRRNGPRTTVFSGRLNITALCTTPIPLCTSSTVWPGNAPQVARGVRYPTPVQALIAIVP